MDNRLAHFDWSLIQSFISVAETGSLSAAARALGLTQPTVGRQIKAFETQVGADLFQRQPRGLILTEAGASLLPAAQRMRDAAGDMALSAAGQDAGLTGTVRITASIYMAQHSLPPILAGLRKDAPEIEIEVVASDAADNLLFREADIAVRMFRPTQLDIVARHLGDMELGVFASESYLERVGGVPGSIEDLMTLDWVGYDRSELIIKGMRQLGIEVSRGFFKTRCDMQTGYWALVTAGCGVGAGQHQVAAATKGIGNVAPGLKIDPMPVWLAMHESLRHVPRIRRVWQALEAGLTPLLRAPS